MMTTKELEYGISAYGTPLYIYDIDEIRDVMQKVRLQTQGLAQICYAMKANPFLTSYMMEMSDRIEVCSFGEYKICEALKIKPEKLLISGVMKDKKEIESILNKCGGNCIYTVESINQFYQFVKWSEEHREKLQIYIRISSGNQFGMDEDSLKQILNAITGTQFIEFKGLHFFSGTQKRKSQSFQQELMRLDQLLQKIEENHGISVSDLEYGPGLALPYFHGQNDNREEDLKILCQSVREMNWKGRVTLEMGRFLVGMSGYYLTSIKDLKTNYGKNYCIVDGGIHQIHYDGQIRGMYCPYVQCIPERKEGTEKNWEVCGALCTDNDVLIGEIKLRDIKIGDTFVFQRTGAYSVTEGMALFLSHPLPATVAFSKENGWRQMRQHLDTYPYNMDGKVKNG